MRDFFCGESSMLSHVPAMASKPISLTGELVGGTPPYLSLCSATFATTFHNAIPAPAACMGPRYVMCGCRIKVVCGMWCGAWTM